MVLRGQVRSGEGNFSFWLEKLATHYTRKTGMVLFPGTLNVHLIDQQYPTPPGALRLEKEEYGGRVSVSICPCRIFGRRAFILRPDGYKGRGADGPQSVVEVATDVNLRDAHDLKDGDIVEVEVDV